MSPSSYSYECLSREEIEMLRDDILEASGWLPGGKDRIRILCDMALRSLSNGPNDELIEARRLLARSIAAMKLGEMGIIKEIYAFLERTDATRESPE